MPRARRPLAPGALYHVTARGNDQEAIYRDDDDRRSFTEAFGGIVRARRWEVHTACLMTNHFHLVLQTPEPDLADGMRELMSAHAQRFNRRHARSGHLFGRRYWTGEVKTDTHHLALFRYVAMNPVQGGVVRRPEAHRWSTHAALAGLVPPPGFLSLGPRDQAFSDAAGYRAFVDGGPGGHDLLAAILASGAADATSAARDAGYSRAVIGARLGISERTVGRLQQACPKGA